MATSPSKSAVADDRGKNVANTTNAIYASTDRFVGLKRRLDFPAKNPQAINTSSSIPRASR